LRLVAQARVARLATTRPDGRVDLVPITFALMDGEPLRLVTAVDHKPKTTTALQRLANIRATPAVTVLVDHYDDTDWSVLWWVRLRGRALVADPGTPAHDETVAALVHRYAQYREVPPAGPAIIVIVDSTRGWSAA